MKAHSVFPVILAGGVGERFWPCSRRSRPKQLIPLLSSKSLFAETLERALRLAPARQVIIVTRAALAKEILRLTPNRGCCIIGEPEGKNTAPAIAAAATWIRQRAPHGTMAVLSSDHRISPPASFVRDVAKAVFACGKGGLVVFGIPPTRPDAGYGYIEAGKPVGRTFAAMRFCEKPDLRTARRFLKAGNYLWNSGMFVWKVSEIMSEFKRQMPSLYRLCLDLERAWGKPCEKRAIAGFYRKAESQSIDYGIMENARKVAVIRASFHWDDVGSWEALWRVRKVDCDGNVTQGKALSVENENSLLFAEDGLVVGAGLRNMVVVQSRGATLVLPRSRLKDMKKLIALVRKREDMKAFLE